MNVDEVLTSQALAFVTDLESHFGERRRQLLVARTERQERISAGELPGFLEETRAVRESDWRIAPTPADLQDRRVEITGPVERKMMINALNSGARVFMADFEDSLSPTWENVIQGQVNLVRATDRTIAFTSPEGKSYQLGDRTATLLVRPRGWHLLEENIVVDGAAPSASLFDAGLFLFHNAARLLERGGGPYFYLPKLEGYLEARLWNDVFSHAEQELGLPHGCVKATVLIETILAAFEMDEILYELRDHAAGLNAGRWDYIFSVIKKFRDRGDMVLPDRSQVTMTVPFMRAYTDLLVRTCHRRGAHAIGGMAAFVPNRRNRTVTDSAIARVREDKEREAGDGFDGTWVAHPDLVPVATEVFDRALGDQPNQLHTLREDVDVLAAQLLDARVDGGTVTEAGVRGNVAVALRYIESWLRGTGAVTIFNLMEDAATAEIARSQIWQWIHHGTRIDDGRPVTAGMISALADAELKRVQSDDGTQSFAQGRWADARALFEEVALATDFVEFLTLPAQPWLSRPGGQLSSPRRATRSRRASR
ncbi:MAG: malate synthase A [Candidatus Dormibacteraeota bacterium]|uniref:Malate synthase n=1 Tax=Candidatus Amunia macphersoniae TaxID=3127014 RepID=A0A934KNB1_9BACT|nr:malate synthase A [Candidatus Dormibacteraeota bacterium]